MGKSNPVTFAPEVVEDVALSLFDASPDYGIAKELAFALSSATTKDEDVREFLRLVSTELHELIISDAV